MTASVQTLSATNRTPLALALGLLATVTVLATTQGGHRLGLATLVGGLAGLALYHASFGFTAAWRRIVTEKRGGGLRAQFILILLTSAVSFSLIAWGAGAGLPAGAACPTCQAKSIRDGGAWRQPSCESADAEAVAGEFAPLGWRRTPRGWRRAHRQLAATARRRRRACNRYRRSSERRSANAARRAAR